MPKTVWVPAPRDDDYHIHYIEPRRAQQQFEDTAKVLGSLAAGFAIAALLLKLLFP
jgi:hypothetical protein